MLDSAALDDLSCEMIRALAAIHRHRKYNVGHIGCVAAAESFIIRWLGGLARGAAVQNQWEMTVDCSMSFTYARTIGSVSVVVVVAGHYTCETKNLDSVQSCTVCTQPHMQQNIYFGVYFLLELTILYARFCCT